MGITRSRSLLRINTKTTFICPWGIFSYCVLPFRLCNVPATFQISVIGIFFDLIHDCVEIYMDDFPTYRNEFDEALENLEKTLIRCKESSVSLKIEKWAMMLTDGIILGYHILDKVIQVDPTKIKVILNLLTPHLQREVWIFLGYAGYYHRFIENFSRISCPLFSLLKKYSKFLWIEGFPQAIGELKSKVSEDPILRGLDQSLPFHISTNASKTTIWMF